MSCAWWQFGPPWPPQYSKPWPPPNILNLPTPMISKHDCSSSEQDNTDFGILLVSYYTNGESSWVDKQNSNSSVQNSTCYILLISYYINGKSSRVGEQNSNSSVQNSTCYILLISYYTVGNHVILMIGFTEFRAGIRTKQVNKIYHTFLNTQPVFIKQSAHTF